MEGAQGTPSTEAGENSPAGERLGEFIDQCSKTENPEQQDLERVYESDQILKKKCDSNADWYSIFSAQCELRRPGPAGTAARLD